MDLLSPLLLVLVAGLLQYKAKDLRLLRLPMQQRCGHDFSIIQYADETILIKEACPQTTLLPQGYLKLFFTDSTGRRVNYHNSNIYPVNISKQKIEVLSVGVWTRGPNQLL
jgi:hypothetical protein